MKAPGREVEVWNRSAERHERDGETTAALFSKHLAYIAQESRDEFEETRQLAQARHEAVLFNAAVRIIQAANRS
jgi:hypothetical protein